jgi:hypothetical protein
MKRFVLLMVGLGFAAGLTGSQGIPAPVLACGPAGPFDFDTHEAEDYVTVYNRAVEVATSGRAYDAVYVVPGGTESYDLRYQGLVSGPRSARSAVPSTGAVIPPSIYKSILWIEANFNNASSEVPFGGVGPVIRSFDCGYGLGQVTTGMANTSGTATAKQAAIGTHFLANLAEGVRILADKWNSAPRFRPIAGNGDPRVLEDWYFAIWSYNGFAFSNHPLNPILSPLRGGRPPETTPAPTPAPPTATVSATASGSATPTGSTTPTASATPTPVPDPFEGNYSPIYHCNQPSAPSFQDQGNGRPRFGYSDYTYPERVYGCMKYPPRRAPVGSPPGAATFPFWPAQDVSMPNFRDSKVAAAFAPEHFSTCQAAGFSGGCPAMDFPTATQGGTTHTDATPPVDVVWRARLLGSPALSVSGPDTATMSVTADGVSSQVLISVANRGTWIAPFRIRTSDPWLVVRHGNDVQRRNLDGGVAIGTDTDVVTQQKAPGPPAKERVAQKGYVSQLVVLVDADLAPSGRSTGTVWIEPLSGDGAAYRLSVTVDYTGGGGPRRPYRLVAPVVSSEPAE